MTPEQITALETRALAAEVALAEARELLTGAKYWIPRETMGTCHRTGSDKPEYETSPHPLRAKVEASLARPVSDLTAARAIIAKAGRCEESVREHELLAQALEYATNRGEAITKHIREIKEGLLSAYASSFPNYAWTDWRTALDLLKAEISTVRAERDAERNELKRTTWRAEGCAEQLHSARNALAEYGLSSDQPLSNKIECLGEQRDMARAELGALGELIADQPSIALRLADVKVAHASVSAERDTLAAQVATMRAALEKLSGCLPDHIYITGDCGENWSEEDPYHDGVEYQEVHFPTLLALPATEAEKRVVQEDK